MTGPEDAYPAMMRKSIASGAPIVSMSSMMSPSRTPNGWR